jgi:hypothetical protein
MTDDLNLAIRNALAADDIIGPAVTDVDGTVRIYPSKVKQESNFPALTYERVSTTRNENTGSYTHSGAPAGYTGLGWARMCIIVWSPEFADTVVLSSAVVKLIHALDLAAGQANRILIDHCTIEPESDVYRHVIDGEIWFLEST